MSTTFSKWKRVYVCGACGFLTPDILVMGRFDPCPKCGERKVREDTGRLVTEWELRRWWRRPTAMGSHWQLIDDFKEASA